jgi:hypothetical protein
MEQEIRRLICSKTPDQLRMAHALWTGCAYGQLPAAVRKWLEHDYPVIAAQVKFEGAAIHWGDETGLRSDDVRGRSFASKGKMLVVRVNSKHGSTASGRVCRRFPA